MKRSREVAVGLVSVLALVALSVGVESQVDRQEFTYNAAVSASYFNGSNTTLGMNVDSDLQFGRAPVGAAVHKSLNLSAPAPTRVDFSSEGNISEVARLPSTRIMEGRESFRVSVNLTSPGNYTGKITVRTAAADGRLAREWLGLQRLL